MPRNGGAHWRKMPNPRRIAPTHPRSAQIWGQARKNPQKTKHTSDCCSVDFHKSSKAETPQMLVRTRDSVKSLDTAYSTADLSRRVMFSHEMARQAYPAASAGIACRRPFERAGTAPRMGSIGEFRRLQPQPFATFFDLRIRNRETLKNELSLCKGC